MRKVALFIGGAWMLTMQGISAQVKPHYTVSGGLLGGINFSNLRVGDNNGMVESGDWKFGWDGGAWVNFPLGNVVSIELQPQYSKVGGKIKTPSPNGNLDEELGYFSVPLLLKFSSKAISLFVGPQFDFLTNAKNKNTDSDNKSAFKDNDISLTGGIEFIPHGRVSIYGRYVHGFSNINKNSSPEYFNQGVHVGVKLKLFGKYIPGDQDGDGVIDSKDKCPAMAGLERYEGCPIPDTDGDGINDENDKCPKQTGVAKYEGCPVPDTDSDGIDDDNDKCPTEAGTAKYQGCPIPDTDGDGVNDENDKCPNQAGTPKYEGCPVPDTDGDGINDDEDKCPNTPGVPEMKGCPKPDYKAHGVTFASGKSVLTNAGKNELDHLYDFLQENQAVNIKLVGYTDNTGTDKINDPLSLARAESSKAYLVRKGIDAGRIATDGRGSANPVADNSTKKGKELNRRIEIEVE